jgi:hypothetical protein
MANSNYDQQSRLKRAVHERIGVPLLLLAALPLGLQEVGAAPSQHERAREIPPARLSLGELASILQRTFNLVSNANWQATNTAGLHEKVSLSNAAGEVEAQGHSLAGEVKWPKTAYRLTYSYSWVGAPISDVRLQCSDGSREIRVVGKNMDQVGAICDAVARDFAPYATAAGGPKARFLARLVFFVIFSMVFTVSAPHCLATRNWKATGIPVGSVVGIILVLTLPFEEWLAGFAAFQGNSTFLPRHAPEVTFLGMLATLAGISISYYLPRWFESGKKGKGPKR